MEVEQGVMVQTLMVFQVDLVVEDLVMVVVEDAKDQETHLQ